MSTPLAPVLALDPGKDKCGVAVTQFDNGAAEILERRIIAASSVEAQLPALLKKFNVATIVLGNATTSSAWRERLSTLLPGIEIVVVDERGSTLAARELYWQQNPPRGWRKVLPLSLQMPPEPIDDFAAVVIAKRYFLSAGKR